MSEERAAKMDERINRELAGTIALSSHAGGAISIVPQSLNDLLEFSKMMAIAGPCVRPAFRGKPGACLAIAMQAFRTGADPFAVANKAFIVNDQIAYEAQYINAVLNTSKQLRRRLRASYKGQGNDRQCTITGYIAGEDEPFEYESPTIAAIPTKNSPLWKGDPDQQLYYYSSRAWARRYLPEVILGMNTPDEVQGQVIDVTPPPPPRREDFAESQILQQGNDLTTLSKETSFEVTDSEDEGDEDVSGSDVVNELLDQAYLEETEAWREKSEPPAVNTFQNPLQTTIERANASKEDAFGLLPLPEQPPAKAPSLAVPMYPGPRPGTTDWIRVAAEMVQRIAGLDDLSDVLPDGRFEHDNREAFKLMRDGRRPELPRVRYALSQRTDELRKAAMP